MFSTGKPPYSSVIRNSITCEDIPPQLKDMLVAEAHFARFGKIRAISLHPTDPSCTVVYENPFGANLALQQGGGTFRDVKFRIRLTERERDDDGGTSTAGTSGGIFSSVAYNTRKIGGFRLEQPVESVPDRWMEKQSMYPRPAGGSNAVDTVDRKILKARNDFRRLGNQPVHTAEKRYQVLHAKDQYIRLCLERTSDPLAVKRIKGTCPNMCPEKERYLRQWQCMVPSYERHSDTRNVVLIDPEKAIKQYPRGNADKERPLPHELRTEQALGRTMHFLLANVVAECDTDKGVKVVEWFNYILDRTRAIRWDIDQQDLCSQTVVTLLEQCARFHIHCAVRVAVEEPVLFDQKFNTENLEDCLHTLKRMYAVMEHRGESCSGEAEFRAYLLLLHLNDEGVPLELQQMSTALVNTPEVQFVLSVHAALKQSNYVRFFELVRATNYMNACIMHRYFTQVRENALSLLLKANPSRTTTRFQLTQLTRTLCFDDERDAQGFFEHYGFSVNRACGIVVLESTFKFYQPATPYWNGPAFRMVASKRICSLRQTICGEPLDRWGAQFPFAEFVSSFDGRGHLRRQILEEILGAEDEPASMSTTYGRQSVKRIERTKIFDSVLQSTFTNSGPRTPKPTEFHQRTWNFSRQSQQSMKGSDTVNRKNEPWRSQLDYGPAQKRDQKQHMQLAENKRVAIGKVIEVIELLDSDSDGCIREIPKKNEIGERLKKEQDGSKLLQDCTHACMTDDVLDYKLSEIYPEQVPQEKNQYASMEHRNTDEEHEIQHLKETKGAGVKGSNDASLVELFESISDEEVWDLLEQRGQRNRKCVKNDQRIDVSSNRATVEFRVQNRNHFGQRKDVSRTIHLEENDSKIPQSPSSEAIQEAPQEHYRKWLEKEESVSNKLQERMITAEGCFDTCDTSSRQTTWQFRHQTKHANWNHHAKGKNESQKIHLQENDSSIPQSPVEMKQTDDATVINLVDDSSSEAIQEAHQEREQSEQHYRKWFEKEESVSNKLQERMITAEGCFDTCDASSRETTWQFRDQTQQANWKHLAKGKEESKTIHLQENDSKIPQSPVDIKQTGDATDVDLLDDSSSEAIQKAHQLCDYEDLQCTAMEEMKLEEEHLHGANLDVVERRTETAFDDLLDLMSSNVQVMVPLERDWNNLDMEEKQHEQSGQANDACVNGRVDSTSSKVFHEIAQDSECASLNHFGKEEKYDEYELLQEHNSVAIEQANDAKLACAASAKVVQLRQEYGGFVMERSTEVAQMQNERENSADVEKEEDELSQPKARRLSASEESVDFTWMLDDGEGSSTTNEAMQEIQDQNEPYYINLLKEQHEEVILFQERRRSVVERSIAVLSTPHAVQESSSTSEDAQEIQQQRESDYQVLYLEKDEKEDAIHRSHKRRCSVMEYATDPSTHGEQSSSTSNRSDSQEKYENDEPQTRDPSNNGINWTSDASTDDEDESSSISEGSSDVSLHYFASVSSISPDAYEMREEEEKPEDIVLRKLMPAAMHRSCEATVDDLLHSVTRKAIQEIADYEVAWHRLVKLYSDKLLSELVDEVLVEVIEVSARAEFEEIEQVRRKQHLLAYKYWHRWLYTVRIAARFHLLLRSVSPSVFNAHPSRCQRVLCETFGKFEPIDPFAVLDYAVQSHVHLRSTPFYWKLVISLCSTDTNGTFESFNTFVDCWLRNSAFKRDPDYEQPGHAYLFYAARALPTEAAICMRLIGDGSSGGETAVDRITATERSNGLLFIMHNYEPIAQVRERLRRLMANVIPLPAIAILHFCPSRCNPVNVGKQLELEKETARWKVFRWRDKADNDPLRAATIFLAGCYRDQLHNAFQDPERLEMCPLITFLHQSVGTEMWFRLSQACCTEAAVIQDGALCKLARDGNEIVRRYNDALRRVRQMVTRQEISSFARIAEEFDPVRTSREGRSIGGVSEALFPPDWHSAERRHQIEQLLDGLQLHAPPDRLLVAMDRAASETMENGRVLNVVELRVALDYYLHDYDVFLTGSSHERQKLVKELQQEVVSQLNGTSFPKQSAGRADVAAVPRHFSWVPLLANVSDTLMSSTVLAMKLPAEVCYRRGELRRYLRTVWGIQQYVSQASSAERSTSTTIQSSPSVGSSLPAPRTSETCYPALPTTTPNQKRQATTPISTLAISAAKRTMKDTLRFGN